MPSGSKKRKAAKKKKEQVANNINSSTNNNPHGNDDPKSQDERDSDGGGGDVGSPASQDDHNHQHPFSKGEEEGKRELSPVQSHVTEDKYVEETTRDAESTEKSGLDDVGVKIEKEWEPKEDLESRHVPIKHVEHGNDDPKSQDERDSDGGGGDVGSPASQDDHNHQHPFSKGEEEGKRELSPVQSHVTEDKYVEETTRDAESTEKSGLDDVGVKIEKEWEPKEDLESRHVPIKHVEHGKSSSSSSSRSTSDDESQAFEKKSKEEVYNLGSEVTSYSNEDKSATVMSEEVLKVAENEKLRHVESNSAVQITPVDNLVKTVLFVTEEVGHAAEISANKSGSDVVESGLKESEEKLLPSLNGTSWVELEENERNFFPSSGTPTAESSNVAEKTQDSEPHDYSEKKPLVASTPPVVRRTSLLSCCGLFDVFTGSGR